MSEKPVSRSHRLWDLPTRLFHWVLVILIAAAWYTGDNAQIDRHETIGIALCALVLFRVGWGVVGSGNSRFRAFIKSPAKAIRYFRGFIGLGPEHQGPCPGHNAAGGWMVVALLVMVSFQVFSGLASNENTYLFYDGPLSGLVGWEWSDRLSEWHGTSFDILLVLIAVHVVVVFAYLIVKKDNLIRPMVTGFKQVPEAYASRFERLSFASPIRAILVMAVVGALIWGVSTQL